LFNAFLGFNSFNCIYKNIFFQSVKLHFYLIILFRCGGKIGSLDFAEGLVPIVIGMSGQKPMCQCGQAKNFKIFRAVGKKLKHEAVGCCVGKRSAPKSIFISFVLMS